MKKFIITGIIAVQWVLLSAQNNVGIGTNTPNSSAKLEINATDKGLLVPRVALTGTTDAVTISTPSTSLLVYNTATAGTAPNNVTPGYYYNSGTSASPVWVRLATSASTDVDWIKATTTSTGAVKTDNQYVTGNVGLGDFSASSPFGILDVKGNILFRGNNTNTPSALISALNMYTGRGSTHAFGGGQTSGDIAFEYAGSSTNGYKHFLVTRHNSAANSTGNAFDFYLNNSATSTASTGLNSSGTLSAGSIHGMSITASGTGIGTTNPDASAKFEVNTTNKGVLLPRIALTSTTDASTISNPATSLLIYNTSTAGTSPNNVTPGYYYNSGTTASPAWVRLNSSSASVDWLKSSTTSTAAASTDNQYVNVNVGIGNFSASNPSAKLHIKGNLMIDAGRIPFANSGSSVFVGEDAGLNDDLTTKYNTFVGFYAGRLTTSGQQNTAFGAGSLEGNTTGHGNVGIGRLTLLNNSTALYNTAVGTYAGYSATGGGNVFLGAFAGFNETGSDKLYIDNTNTNSPLIYGNFATDQINVNGSLGVNTLPASSAILDLNSSSKGARLPNVALTSTTDASTISSPVTSLLVYNTATAGSSPNNVTPGFYFNSGTTASPVWTRLLTSVVTIADTLNWTRALTSTTGAFQGDDQYVTGFVGLGDFSTSSPVSQLHVKNGNIMQTGTVGNGSDIEVSGSGTRMFFNIKKSAFRAGTVDGTQWNAVNVGAYSAGFGQNTTASGLTSFTAGYGNTASAGYSSAFGNSNTASGTYSAVFGQNNIVSAPWGFAAGQNNTVSGNSTSAFGNQNTVSGFSGASFGENNTVSGNRSLSAGQYNNVTGNNNITCGNGNTVSGENNLLVGFGNISTYDHSFACGYTDTIGASATMVFGFGNKVTAFTAFAAGDRNKVSGQTAFAAGANNIVAGQNAFAAGQDNFAPSKGEISLGIFGTEYTASSSTNVISTDRLVNIGNGSSIASRSDAFTILKNGNVGLSNSTPDASAILDINSSSKGIRIPNVTLTGTTDATTISSPAASLMVYNTATAGSAPNNVVPGYYYNSGTSGSPVWFRLLTSGSTDVDWAKSSTTSTAATKSDNQYVTGNVGLGDFSGTNPSFNLSIAYGADKTIGAERSSSSGNQDDLIIQAGGAQAGASNNHGGNLVLSAGTCTGDGYVTNGSNNLNDKGSYISFKTATPLGSSGTADQTPTEKMRILGDGTVNISNLAGTGTRPVYADASGNLVAPSTNVLTSSNHTATTVGSNTSTTVINSGSSMSVSVGDVIIINATVSLRLTGGANTDDFYVRVNPGGTAAVTYSTGTTTPMNLLYTPDESSGDHDNTRPVSYLEYGTVTTAGTLNFALVAQNTGDDGWEYSQAVMVVRKQ